MKNNPSSSDSEFISFKEIKNDARKITSSESLNTQEIIQSLRAEAEARQLLVQVEGQKQFLELQKSWADHIKWQIWAVLLFQFAFVLVIGLNWKGFTENINKLPYMYVGVILQSLANIIALGFVVAKFLFPQLPNSSKK